MLAGGYAPGRITQDRQVAGQGKDEAAVHNKGQEGGIFRRGKAKLLT